MIGEKLEEFQLRGGNRLCIDRDKALAAPHWDRLGAQRRQQFDQQVASNSRVLVDNNALAIQNVLRKEIKVTPEVISTRV